MSFSLQVHCGINTIEDSLAKTLSGYGLEISSVASWHLVYDAPLGYATLKLLSSNPTRTIIVSDNPCPAYQLNLLEHKPAALFSWSDIENRAQAIRNIQLGQTFYPAPMSPLTSKERLTLQLVAEGFDMSAVAQKLRVKDGTLRNRMRTIYTKLGLTSRVQLAHYYYGRWLLLMHYHDWQPPATLKGLNRQLYT